MQFHMISPDDTTTVTNDDNDNDQTQILSGQDRLKYFDDNACWLFNPPPRRKSWLQRLKNLFN